jgi:hypothetical protein
MSRVILILSLFLLVSCASEKPLVRKFVRLELKNYPEARLTDLYKNYFQDAYGPGHLIPDTTSAGRYLDWELQQTDYTDPVTTQELGIHHDFVRVNLDLCKKGVIPRGAMLKAMTESAPMAKKPALDVWKKEWHNTVHLIKALEPSIQEFREDSLKIEEMLEKGEVAVHHSTHFSEKYHPHYRIIHRTIFDAWKESYLKEMIR